MLGFKKQLEKYARFIFPNNLKSNHLQIIELITLTLITVSTLIYFSLTAYINADEREHITSTFYIYSGQIPYLDFFEHHHPLLWYIFLPIIHFFINSEFIWYAARIFIFCLLILNAVILTKICSLIKPEKTFIWLTLILSICPHVVFLSQIEFRPDNLMITLFLAGFYFYLQHLKEQKTKSLILSFIFFFFSVMASQKVMFLLFALFILSLFLIHKKELFLKNILIALIIPIILAIIYVSYLYCTNSLKDYFELNWLLNLKISSKIKYPVHQTAYYLIANLLSVLVLFIKSPRFIKYIAFLSVITCFLLQFCFSCIHKHYWLPVYPFFAIITAYFIVKSKTDIQNIILGIMIIAICQNNLTYYKEYKQYTPLHIFVYLSKQILTIADKNDEILGTISTLGGLRKDVAGYYWFARDHVAILDYHYFNRHPFPNRESLIKNKRPKIFSTEAWRICITKDYEFTFDCKQVPISADEQQYIDKHYTNQGFIYIRKD